MKSLPLALLLPAIGLVAGCPDDPGPQNPEQLWLALLVNETMVQLVPQEPDYF